MTGSWFSRPRQSKARGFAPESTRLYAIGDIHGRADLLRELHDMIRADAGDQRLYRKMVIYLGDYIDRGDDSPGVIDLLRAETLADAGFESKCLIGNHERALLDFLQDPATGPGWVMNGGEATLLSYGVGHPRGTGLDDRWRWIRDRLLEGIPAAHLAFLNTLEQGHIEGGYLFVHAGIRPGVPLEKQTARDMLWIRGDFLDSKADHGVCVVHGHTVSPEPDIRPNRIGIDTGAYYSGRLTCLVLEDTTRRFLHTGPAQT
jgi:diadenosine tetraphosphatase ApaH/serine/threonine PP2A family protein phosphatase